MPSQKLIVLLMFVGSIIGAYLPVMLGASAFGYASLFGSAIGAVAGLWLAFRISR